MIKAFVHIFLKKKKISLILLILKRSSCDFLKNQGKFWLESGFCDPEEGIPTGNLIFSLES